MDTTTNNTKTVARPTQRLRVYAIVALVAFLIGLVPMWLSNRTITRERDDSQQALRLARIENSLAAAAIRARRGEYEPARQAASTFFTDLRNALDRTPSVFSDTHRQSLEALLAPRDQVITWLARSDPAGAEHLSNAYVETAKRLDSKNDPTDLPLKPVDGRRQDECEQDGERERHEDGLCPGTERRRRARHRRTSTRASRISTCRPRSYSVPRPSCSRRCSAADMVARKSKTLSGHVAGSNLSWRN